MKVLGAITDRDIAIRLVGVISLSDLAQRDDGARVAQTMRQVTAREAHP